MKIRPLVQVKHRFSYENAFRLLKNASRYLLKIFLWLYSKCFILKIAFKVMELLSEKTVYKIFPTLHLKVFEDLRLDILNSFNKHNIVFDRKVEGLYLLPKIENFYPMVSVIVPCYNHEPYLHKRLESIYGQTYKNIEVILLDDCSDDNSRKILNDYASIYKEITKCIFNKKNSGNIFSQWKKGIDHAKGDLIWIAESDDFCTSNFLEEMVGYFKNDAVMISFCRTEFVDENGIKTIWTLEKYLSDIISPKFWKKPFIKSAHNLVNQAWGAKNIIPNVSSAIFRKSAIPPIINKPNWQKMRICGDWVFYLHTIRGGLVAYSPLATNYYRIHNSNASVSTYNQQIYYQEHAEVAKETIKLFKIDENILEKQYKTVKTHWQLNCDKNEAALSKYYDFEKILEFMKNYRQRKPNIMMASYAFIPGGGEIFPIRLANYLSCRNYPVTFLNFCFRKSENSVRAMLSKRIPVVNLYKKEKLRRIIQDMGIDIIHSHYAWIDALTCAYLKNYFDCKVVITTHGLYEMLRKEELDYILRHVVDRADKIVYISDKNIEVFPEEIKKEKVIKIGNALEPSSFKPVSRASLGLSDNAFVLCVVSRAIPEKGWVEAIEAVKLARQMTGLDICLLLIGNGPEYDRLIKETNDPYIRLLGFKENVMDYFATSDLGFLPSRFKGESFPLTIIECLQAGKPVLASNVGEISEMIQTEQGPAGSVFELNNWQIPVSDVASIIARYVTDRKYYISHLDNAKIAAKKFDISKMVDNYESVYMSVLKT